MTQKKIATIEWLIGQLETDGTFLLNIRKDSGLWNPSVRLSSKSNTNTLKLAADLIEKEFGMKVQYEKAKKTKNGMRAPFIKFGGKYQVLKFLKKLRQSKLFFTGSKFRDCLIMEEALTNPTLTIAQKIGLKKSLHKSNRNDPDLKTSSQTISRETYEINFNIALNESKIESENILTNIDNLWEQYKKDLLHKIHNRSLKVPPDYVKGFIDGDGNLNIGTTVQNGRPIWNAKISIALDANSESTAKVFKYAFNSNASITKVESNGQIICLVVALRNQKDISSVQNFFLNNGPLFGDLRNEQLGLFLEYMDSKDQGD